MPVNSQPPSSSYYCNIKWGKLDSAVSVETFINFNLEREPQSMGRFSTEINRESSIAHQLLKSTWRCTNKTTVRDYGYYSEAHRTLQGWRRTRLFQGRARRQPAGQQLRPGRSSGCTTRGIVIYFFSDVTEQAKVWWAHFCISLSLIVKRLERDTFKPHDARNPTAAT